MADDILAEILRKASSIGSGRASNDEAELLRKATSIGAAPPPYTLPSANPWVNAGNQLMGMGNRFMGWLDAVRERERTIDTPHNRAKLAGGATQDKITLPPVSRPNLAQIQGVPDVSQFAEILNQHPSRFRGSSAVVQGNGIQVPSPSKTVMPTGPYAGNDQGSEMGYLGNIPEPTVGLSGELPGELLELLPGGGALADVGSVQGTALPQKSNLFMELLKRLR